jgi:hypothetical protein
MALRSPVMAGPASHTKSAYRAFRIGCVISFARLDQ